MNDHLASSMFGKIKESDLTAMDNTSFDLQSSSYLNSSETYLTCLHQNLSQKRCYEDVKPFDYRLTDAFFDDQTQIISNSKLVSNSVQDLYNGSYDLVLAEIRQVLKMVCDMHCLPLAQTWSPCAQQGRPGCQQGCISVIDSASYVFDPNVLGFYEACSELHVGRGEGIAGKAIGTNQPCITTDITGFCRSEYPLADHAKAFGLHGAVAIRLRSTYTGPIDFVLEFFLPRDFRTDEEQKLVLSAISGVIRRVSRSLYVMNDDELAKEEDSVSVKDASGLSSWISDMMEAQRRGESVIVSMATHKEEPQEFQVINQWNYPQSTLTGDRKQIQPDLRPKPRRRPLATRRSEEKKRVKMERNISLPLLQQYFPGSLKDAAKSIGVCPTTLKRICREHGIMRWPSRKIKKVGHSLKKLQLIIDSVQGAEGTIQLGSFYTSFPELSSPNSSNPKPTNACVKKTRPCSSSSDSHNSGSSTLCCSKDNTLDTQKPAQELRLLLRSQSEKRVDEGVFRIKAIYGGQYIRLHMSQDWGFGDLQREIMRRISINDINILTLKYLDDDFEWVLLTCDADLEECKDINMASKKCTIKIFLSQSFHQESGSSFIGNC